MLLILEMLLISLGLLMCIHKDKLSYLGLFFLVLALSIPDLYYVTNPTNDLYEYFREMNITRNCDNISSLFLTYKETPILFHHSSNLLFDIYDWLISKTGIYTLLSFFNVLIIYLSLFIPFIHQRVKYKNSFKYILLGILLIMSLFPYDGISSTIRWTLASGIFFIILYVYCNVRKRNRKWCLLLFVPLLFIHEAMVIPVGIVILCTLIRKMKLTYCVAFILCMNFLFALSKHSSLGAPGGFLSSIRSYTDGSITLSMVIPRTALFIQFIIVLLSPYLYLVGSSLLIKQNYRKIDLNAEVKLLLMFLSLNIVLMPSIITFQRYSLYVGMISILIYAKVIKYGGIINVKTKLIYLSTLIPTILIPTIFIPYFMNFDFSKLISYVGSY